MKITLRSIVAFIVILLAGCSSRPPITWKFRSSALDSSGLVLQIFNQSEQSLSCSVLVHNDTRNEEKKYLFDVGPHGSKEIGMLEMGWSFKSGESVYIAAEGHSDIYLKVP